MPRLAFADIVQGANGSGTPEDALAQISHIRTSGTRVFGSQSYDSADCTLSSSSRASHFLTMRQTKFCYIPLSFTLTLGPSLLMCLIGFLAWGVPSASLSTTIAPIASSLRAQVLNTTCTAILEAWTRMHSQMLSQWKRWEMDQWPIEELLDPVKLSRICYPILLYQPDIIGCPTIVAYEGCIHVSVLQNNPIQGWLVDRQNCTHHWLEKWDPVKQDMTGQVVVKLPMYDQVTAGLVPPLTLTTPAQPFTWFGLFNPKVGVGDLLEADVGLFDAETQLFIGRSAISMSTAYLRQFVHDAIRKDPAMWGGRLALYENSGMVVAASHGKYDQDHQFHLSEIGDDDLEAAGSILLQTHGAVCTNVQLEMDLSVRYLMDVVTVSDPHPSVQPLKWCAMLLVPHDNLLAAVDQSRSFAITLVCSMTFGTMLISLAFGLLVTHPVKRLANGLDALRESNFKAARNARGGRCFFSELAIAQESFDLLVDAIDAFGKYVPKKVVRGLLTGRVPQKLGMVERNVAVAFMDMENFTCICEAISPQEVVAVTGRIFDMCCDRILASQGCIDKFIGDCVMAMWGAPSSVPSPGRNALRAVLDILSISRSSPILLQTGGVVKLRIGVHGGVCLVGNFGATDRWDYTCIGDVVNVAARLEPLNKQCGTQCLTSGTIQEQVATSQRLQCLLRPMGNFLLLGKQQPVAVWELLEFPVEDAAGWGEAIDNLQTGRFTEAQAYFASLPLDKSAQQLLQEIQEARQLGIAGDFMRIMRRK